MRAALAGQSKGVAPSIVMAEEEADESAVALIVIEAVAATVVAGEAPAHVQPQHRQRPQREPKANAVAADHVPVDIGLEIRLAHIGEERPLNLGKVQISERRA